MKKDVLRWTLALLVVMGLLCGCVARYSGEPEDGWDFRLTTHFWRATYGELVQIRVQLTRIADAMEAR